MSAAPRSDAELLARVPGLDQLSLRDREAFLAHAYPLDFAADVPVLRQGEDADSAFLVLSGKCRVEVRRGGVADVVGYVWPGAILGEVGLYCTGTQRGATVVPEEPVRALLLTREMLTAPAVAPVMARLERRALSDLADRVRRSNRTRQRVESQAEALSENPEPDGFLARLVSRWKR